MPLDIAFLGTGLMGAPMARNLLRAGFAVTVWNRSADKARPLVDEGATIAATAAGAVRTADVVIAIVSDGSAVRALLDGGVAEAMQPGAVFVDMSSIKPREAQAHFELLAVRGVHALDAPVSGGTRGAAEATLAIMAGGEQAAFDKARPALAAMGRPTLVGPPGTGQMAKLANQGIVATTIGIVAEAMLLMQSAGADPNQLREALKGGFADSIILQQHGKRMADGDFTPGGKSALQLKDLDNLLEAAAGLGLRLPQAELQQARYHRFVHELGGAELDHAGLFLELKDRQEG